MTSCTRITRLLPLLALFAFSVAGHAAPVLEGQALVMQGGGGEVGFDRQTGHIVFIHRNKVDADIAATPTDGDLWTLHLRGGKDVRAADFLHERPLMIQKLGPQADRLLYTSAQGATVTVDVTGSASGVDLRLSVKGLPDDVLDAAIPADLSFDPAPLQRVLFPEHLGIALMPSFFQAHLQAASWDSVPLGPEGLRQVAGVDCRTDPQDSPPVAVHATPLGQRLLGVDLAAQWQAAPRSVNRAPVQKPDLNLLTSDAGSYLGGHQVGDGLLVRFGGEVRAGDGPLVVQTAEQLCAALAGASSGLSLKPHGTRVVLVNLTHGPARGAWSNIAVTDWQARLKASPVLARAGLTVSVADSLPVLLAALKERQTFAIVNPYGEDFPGGDAPNVALAAIRGFLQQGGLWLETGGYSFYTSLKPNNYLSMEDHYPSRAFSDFGRIETAAGNVSIYGVQDAHDPGHIFVPSAWLTDGDAEGGHLRRRWQTFLPKAGGETPVVRLRMADADTAGALRTYAKDNGLDRPLAAKMSPRVLELWKRSVLIKLVSSSVGNELAILPYLPTPAVLHLVSYLHGGFDRQYPDHFPPNPLYGTPDQFRQLLALAHSKGDLVMPYTNTTWWPDNPKGPTFQHAGEAPLLVGLDGKHSHEVYGSESSGWSISPFHPAVTASVDRLVGQFTQEYPVDILFGDQNGARGLMYDLNPASPTPYAYTQGMIALAGRAAAKLPVATEDGFDHLANVESEFCGLTEELFPFPYDSTPLLSTRLPDADWQFFPMAQYVAHDKTLFMNHDLGQGIWGREALMWSLELGYGLSYPVGMGESADPQKMRWLSYLAGVQRTLGPSYMGAPLTAFHYLRGSGSQGVIGAIYGRMRILVNFTSLPYADGNFTIAPHDFRAQTGQTVVTLPPDAP